MSEVAWLRQLPSADAEDGASDNAKAILGMDHVDIGHPGVAVVNGDDSPREWARDYDIEADSGYDAWAVVGSLYRPVTPFGIVAEGSVAVVPGVQ